MANKIDPCIHGCGRNAETKDGECKVCRNGLYYWKRKTASERLKRRNQLDVLSSRLDTHFDMRGKRNADLVVQPEPQSRGRTVLIFRKRRKA